MEERELDPGTPVERAAGFELERALAEWRAGFTEVDEPELDELEDHLRAEFARLGALGLTPEDAWWLARRKLGASDALEREFAKVGGQRPVLVLVLGFLAVALSLRVLEALAGVALVVSMRLDAGLPMLVATGIVAAGMASFVLARLLSRTALALPGWGLRSPGMALGFLVAGYALLVPAISLAEGYMVVTTITPGRYLDFSWGRKGIEVALVATACAVAWFASRRTHRRAVGA